MKRLSIRAVMDWMGGESFVALLGGNTAALMADDTPLEVRLLVSLGSLVYAGVRQLTRKKK